MIVKFTSETSKKTLPTASILILAVVVGVFGIVTVSDPSLDVLARRTVGKLYPPSVERRILTLAAETGELAVPATFHVTVLVEFPVQDTAVFGCVTTNGPAAAVVVSCMKS